MSLFKKYIKKQVTCESENECEEWVLKGESKNESWEKRECREFNN